MSNPESAPVGEPAPTRKRRTNLVWVFLAALLLVMIGGAVAGYYIGTNEKKEQALADTLLWDSEQFQLAGQDILAGNYSLAVERLDEVLKNEPDFPGAAALREQALAAMNATPTPIPTETPVPSPTPDAPRAEQMLAKARQQFADKQYEEMIRTLLTLRVEIPDYQPERVDGLIWVALRYYGVDLIKSNSLAEGMYYLDLAAMYAPLDKEALDQIESARYFLNVYQSAYYYRTKDIEVSLGYFRIAVSLRPSYSEKLIPDFVDMIIQNADALVHSNACAAWDMYNEALEWDPDNEPAIKGRDYAIENCGYPEPIPAETDVPTPTPG
jgi:tetratricopeptide (TPR) repeat protein